MVFSLALNRNKNWTLEKQDRKNIEAFEFWCWRRLLRTPQIAKKTSKWTLEQINPKKWPGINYYTSNTLCKELNYLEKSIMLRQAEGKKESGWARARWIDSITAAMGSPLKDLKNQLETDHPGANLLMWSPRLVKSSWEVDMWLG